MLRLWKKGLGMTDGERCLALAYVIVSGFGAALAFVIVTQLGNGAGLDRPFSNYESWIVLSGAIGSGCALYLAGGRIGQSGAIGFLRGCIAAIWISTVGAIIAGTLALPLYGTMFGPFVVIVTLLGQPLLAVFWFANLLAAHILVLTWRKERNSILYSLGQNEQGIRIGRLAVIDTAS